jgi:metal-responsive CopG/Arc/MetJ family transcriptional regulator
MVNVLIPIPLLEVVDNQADADDMDRARWIRDAAREKLERDNPAALKRLLLVGGAQ